MWRRQASKVVPMLQAAAAAMKLDSGRHGDDFIVCSGNVQYGVLCAIQVHRSWSK